MKRIRSITLTLVILGVLKGVSLKAQDPHFSQFYAAPMLLNPALTGAFDGQLRASMIYRDQWRSAMATPFATTSAALDFRFPLKIGGRNVGDAASAGVVFLNDRVREYDYSFNQIVFSGAFHKMLNKRTNQILSAGAQFGVGQRNVNYSNLLFQDQFSILPSGQSGYFNESRENLPSNNIAYIDMSVGVNYSYAPKGKPGIYAGVAAMHVNQPDLSFYRRDDETLAAEPLYRKYAAHVAGTIPFSNTLSIQPRAMILAQGKSLQSVMGTNFRMKTDAFSKVSLHVGAWGRAVRKVDGFGMDAVIAMLGIEYHNVLLGTSYDVGISPATSAMRGGGSFEISLAYLGNYENDALLCPQF